MRNLLFILLFLLLSPQYVSAQSADCAYPIIFLHGWTGNETSFQAVYDDPDFKAIWGELDDIFHAVLNATTESNIWGVDGIPGNADDDVLVDFVNEDNNLSSGCIYAINFENFWNEDPSNPMINYNSGSTPSAFDSDSNEASILKQGYALGKMIEKVLAANPGKEKVILIGHSMGGLTAREYLQRRVPENATGTPRWWVDPSNPSGHKVAKLVTTTTPHLGSNTLGNISLKVSENENDALPDLASEAVRDLRYSYSCGFLGFSNCPGVYLYGGNEDDFIILPFPYWSEDVDCDGDETSPNVVGVNIDGVTQGVGDEWDGTYDNPNLPLPSNIRYTWVTSDILGDDGDGVVGWSRQWLYDGAVPKPSDGTAFRLADSLLTDYSHITITGDLNTIITSMDEGDYPAFAFEVEMDKLYAGLAQRRSDNAPESPTNNDPDWYQVELPATFCSDLVLSFTPNSNRSGRIDFFTSAPTNYENMAATAVFNASFGVGSGLIDLIIPKTSLTPNSTYFFRIIHENVLENDWQSPYHFDLSFPPSIINTEDFEGGWGIWNDGGSDCLRNVNDAPFANNGSYCVRIRDNTNTSIMTSNSLDLSMYDEVTIDFSYITVNFANGEDFWVQMSDNGSAFATVEDWVAGTDFNNNIRESGQVTLTGPFSSTVQFRFRVDASANSDRAYFDDVTISGCLGSGGGGSPTQYTLSTSAIGQGTIAPASGTFDEGTSVNLTATPAAGWQFDNWSGDLTGSANPANIIMDADKIVMANFSQIGGGGCTYSTIDAQDFEGGWGIWNDGGSDCLRNVNDAPFANSGSYCIRIRDNTNTSVMTSNSLDLSTYDEITIDFSYITVGFTNGEDFWVQMSDNGGAFTTVEDWVAGTDFNNNIRESGQVVLTGPFSNTVQFRFRVDASANSDRAYFDDVTISGCSTGGGGGPTQYTLSTSAIGQGTIAPASSTFDEGTSVNLTATPATGWQFDNWSGDLTGSANPANIVMDANKIVMANFSQIGGGGCTYSTIDAQDFEGGWGIWVDGGQDCRRNINDAPFANSGSYCIRIQDNTNTSVMTSSSLDLSMYDEVTIDFSYITVNLFTGEDFWVQMSDNGGAFTTVEDWVAGTDFNNNIRESGQVVLTGPFSNTVQFRFRVDASGNPDRVYFDDVMISGCMNSGGRPAADFTKTSSTALAKENNIDLLPFKLFPNPVYEKLTIAYELEAAENATLVICDFTGQVIHQTQITGNGREEVEVGNLPAGCYFVHLIGVDKRRTEKFLVMKY